MKILVIGGGGREHALIGKLKESKTETEIIAAPGNGGIAGLARCVDIDSRDIEKIVEFSLEEKVDLVIVTPDDPLVLGLVDELNKAGIMAFGPTRVAAVLEGSKSFAKAFMKRHDIPTADYHIASTYGEAIDHIESISSYPAVIKADGLALGKGVVIAKDKKEATSAIRKMMLDRCFGDSGNQIVFEEFLEGPEISVLAATDGRTIKVLTSAQDHKRAYDGDLGPNTGGMGAIAPHPLFDRQLEELCYNKIFKPTIDGMLEENRLYKGILYFGLMLTKNGPYVIEYNCRFGDPETQVVLPLLDCDIIELIMAICQGQLHALDIRQKKGAAACVIMASLGYPLSYEKGYLINGLEEAKNLDGITVYHAGTTYNKEDGTYRTNGGRVLGVTATADNLSDAIDKAYLGTEAIHFQNAFYRKDIGGTRRKTDASI